MTFGATRCRQILLNCICFAGHMDLTLADIHWLYLSLVDKRSIAVDVVRLRLCCVFVLEYGCAGLNYLCCVWGWLILLIVD